ncbi:MAG: NADH-quinone oxidoreductase subunit C [Pseudomonadota bacterium]
MYLQEIKKFKGLIPVVLVQTYNDENCITILNKNIVFVLRFLSSHIGAQYKMLTCISGIDLLNLKYRFCVTYDLLSLTFNTRLRVKLFIDEVTPVPSITNTFINADWWEREIWDLYGIYFDKHLDLRRILTDYGFEGHPLRKDFPLSGYVELRYNENKKQVVAEPLELTQEFRSFVFETPW